MITINKIAYIDVPCDDITPEILIQCAELFSRCYGVWSSSHLKAGQRVSLTPERLRKQCAFDDSCRLITAKYKNQLLGHAFYTSFNLDNSTVRWITQLVVDDKVRNMKIAQNLIFRCIGTTAKIVGLCTSHPYAVKALEKAGSRVDPKKTAEYAKSIVKLSNIPYLKSAILKCTNETSLIDTNFHVDHTEINNILDSLIKGNKWQLGALPDGHEFFAIIFR